MVDGSYIMVEGKYLFTLFVTPLIKKDKIKFKISKEKKKSSGQGLLFFFFDSKVGYCFCFYLPRNSGGIYANMLLILNT